MADGNAPAYDVPASALAGRARNGVRRSITLNASRASKAELHRLQMEHNAEEIATYDRPITRGDCLPGGCNGARPCPWVSCKAHLALDVDEHTGSIKVNFPDLDVWQMPRTCALDVADEGGKTPEEVGVYANLVRERVRQIEARALAGVAQSSTLLEYLDAAPTIHRGAQSSKPVRAALPQHKGRARTRETVRARLVLERGGGIEEASLASGLTRRQVQNLAWRMRREASK